MSAAYEDLLKDSSQSFEDGNYFLVTILDLDLGSTYPIQFKYKYKDGTSSKDWSAAYNIPTPISTVPNEPKLLVTDVVAGGRFIKVTWSGNDASGNPLTNIDRVDVHISGTSFGDGTKPSGSFKEAGTQTFVAEPGIYIVQLKAVTVNGATSFFSDARTVTVTDVGITVQTPTLPSGLSVATAPFAVTVNWSGTYSSSTFTGFKSIDIYAVGSDLGSSVTSGITSTNLVGSLTVNNTPNKINISLDNLKQALGLSSNSDVYSASIFYYYNATNTDGTKYGSPTYTRINSSSVVPTKANFVDLASGVISIENLVAGNGNFSSWLRTGSSGGARIELSAVSDFTNSGYTVQKGLTAYSSGNTEIFKLDLDSGALTINGSGTFSGNLSAAGGTFAGTLSAASGSFSGTITASGGTIGGITIAASALQNNSVESSSTFKLDSAGKARFGAYSGSSIIIDPAAAVGGAYLYHSSNGGSAASGNFTFLQSGGFRLGGSSGINYNGSNQITIGSSGNPITINTSTGSVSISGTLTANSLDTPNLDIASDGSITTLSNNFGVTSGGILSATGATISGTINASGGTFSGNITATGTISGGTISGATITGGTVRTASSGDRIEINNGSYLNQMAFYTSATYPGIIYSFTSGSQNILSISSPYSTGNQGNISVYSLAPNSYISLSADQTSASGTMTASTFYTGAFDSSSVAYAPGTYISTSGAIISRRDDFIPMFAHRFSTASPYTGATNREMWRGILEGTLRGSIYISMTGSPSLAVPSDYRLKENIRDYNGSIDIIKSKRLRVFNLKNDPTKTDTVGFIAHEFGEDNSELVIGSKDAVDKDGNPEYQSVAFTNLIPYLTGALKEIILKVESLEQRLDALEG